MFYLKITILFKLFNQGGGKNGLGNYLSTKDHSRQGHTKYGINKILTSNLFMFEIILNSLLI